jgi:hypothetical protein
MTTAGSRYLFARMLHCTWQPDPACGLFRLKSIALHIAKACLVACLAAVLVSSAALVFAAQLSMQPAVPPRKAWEHAPVQYNILHLATTHGVATLLIHC